MRPYVLSCFQYSLFSTNVHYDDFPRHSSTPHSGLPLLSSQLMLDAQDGLLLALGLSFLPCQVVVGDYSWGPSRLPWTLTDAEKRLCAWRKKILPRLKRANTLPPCTMIYIRFPPVSWCGTQRLNASCMKRRNAKPPMEAEPQRHS